MTWAFALAALLLVPASVALGLLPRPLWLVMGWGGVMLAMYLSVLPHEFGHALMARAVGYRPLAIVWGSFPPVIDRNILGVRTLIGLAPVSGFACFDPIDDRWPRLKHFAVTAAGPLVNVLLAVLAISAATLIEESFKQSILKFVLLVFGLANAWLALGNLWPSTVMTIAGKMPTDGARLLTFLSGKPVDLALQRASASQTRLFFAFRDGDYDQVLREADEAETRFGPQPWIDVGRSAALCNLDQPERARQLLRAVIDSAKMQADVVARAMAENNIAWANFVIDDPVDDADSLARSERAIAVLPWLAPVVITRCCVLASRADPGSERLSEARALLSRVGELEMNALARLAAAIAAGLIAAAEGDVAEARRQLETAQGLGDPGLAGRVLEARLPSL